MRWKKEKENPLPNFTYTHVILNVLTLNPPIPARVNDAAALLPQYEMQSGKADDSPLMDPQRFSSLSKDELKEVLLQERQKPADEREREYQAIRDTFEEQVRKEIAYRGRSSKAIANRPSICSPQYHCIEIPEAYQAKGKPNFEGIKNRAFKE
ncbi:hypothetical protein CEXT_571461 [Caerostris extrusa]|uniref:Uncharacterized protein n=1 Tax=Caerostris extrusa TaxID=172846 RepID=A0AAV4R7D3_CAEEX|nr:hypothetical protein CEXT_571461 [Caerostris extrusa]